MGGPRLAVLNKNDPDRKYQKRDRMGDFSSRRVIMSLSYIRESVEALREDEEEIKARRRYLAITERREAYERFFAECKEILDWQERKLKEFNSWQKKLGKYHSFDYQI